MERHSRVHLDHPTIRGRMRSPQVRRAQPQSNANADIRITQPTVATGQPTGPSIQPSDSTNQPRDTVAQPSFSNPQSTLSQLAHPHAKQPNVLKNRTVSIPAKPGKTAHLPRQTRSGVLRRQMVKASSKKYRPQKHRSFKPYLITGVAVFVLLLGSAISIITYNKIRADSTVKAVLAKQTVEHNLNNADDGTSANDLPSEDNPPVDISGYTVADSRPRYLIINVLGVKARVRRVGVDNNNIIKGPSNIYDVGWYENSAQPGNGGTTLIDGHVAGQTNRGVFFGLNTLKKGDKIEVERGDGKRISYTVASTEQADFDTLNMKKVLNSVAPGKPGLNLMTASSRYNVRTSQYEKRVIIYATQD